MELRVCSLETVRSYVIGFELWEYRRTLEIVWISGESCGGDILHVVWGRSIEIVGLYSTSIETGCDQRHDGAAGKQANPII